MISYTWDPRSQEVEAERLQVQHHPGFKINIKIVEFTEKDLPKHSNHKGKQANTNKTGRCDYIVYPSA